MLRNWLVIIVLLLPILGYAGKKSKHIECTSSGENVWECEISSKKARFDCNASNASASASAEDRVYFGDLDLDLDFGDLDFDFDFDFGEHKKVKKKW